MTAIQPLTPQRVMHALDGDHADGNGLLLRVRGANASWVFRYTAASGRRREMGLGVAMRNSLSQATGSLEAARTRAVAARALLHEGKDPIDTRDEHRVVTQRTAADRRAKTKTLAQAARDYHEKFIEPKRTPKHSAQWISSLERHIPHELWNTKLREISGRDVVKAVLAVQSDERARRPTNMRETKSRIFSRVRAAFQHAVFEGWIDEHPLKEMELHFRAFLGEERIENFRSLPWRQAPGFAKQVAGNGTLSADVLLFALLTCARTSEVIGAEWSEIDWEASTWTIPAARMKCRFAHTVFLSTQARDLLRRQPEPHGQYVFPSPDIEGQHISNMAMLNRLDKLGLRDQTTVHGLRSTFSTWANETGAARPDVIETCLAHISRDVVRRAYNHAEYRAERALLLQAWADYLMPRSAAVQG